MEALVITLENGIQSFYNKKNYLNKFVNISHSQCNRSLNFLTIYELLKNAFRQYSLLGENFCKHQIQTQVMNYHKSS